MLGIYIEADPKPHMSWISSLQLEHNKNIVYITILNTSQS